MPRSKAGPRQSSIRVMGLHHRGTQGAKLIAYRRRPGKVRTMGLKIKWNDDRVRGAMTAVLLIGRDRLARGLKEDLVRASLAEYRADPEGYKQSRKTWPDIRELGPLSKSSRVTYYQELIAAVDQLTAKWTQAKRQFNSLLELDNALIEQLPPFR